MTTITKVLGQFAEALPKWLETYRQGDPFDRKEFFSSRIVYYPGAGGDGHAVKLFNQAHAAHVFIQADYGWNRKEIKAQLDPRDRQHPRGYHPVGIIEVTQLARWGSCPHVERGELAAAGGLRRVHPYAFVAVFERDADYDEQHGASRFAVLFLGADGIVGYHALFCCGADGRNAGCGATDTRLGNLRAGVGLRIKRQNTTIAAKRLSPIRCRTSPYALLLQDHGLGGNYDRFGRGGLLEQFAIEAGVFPEWLVVGEWTKA
jgi:hypothetical protein